MKNLIKREFKKMAKWQFEEALHLNHGTDKAIITYRLAKEAYFIFENGKEEEKIANLRLFYLDGKHIGTWQSSGAWFYQHDFKKGDLIESWMGEQYIVSELLEGNGKPIIALGSEGKECYFHYDQIKLIKAGFLND